MVTLRGRKGHLGQIPSGALGGRGERCWGTHIMMDQGTVWHSNLCQLFPHRGYIFVEFAILLFLHSNIGLHEVSLPVTSVEFFSQCLDFLCLVFNRGDVGLDEVFDYFLKEWLFRSRFEHESCVLGRKDNTPTTTPRSGLSFKTCSSFTTSSNNSGVSAFIWLRPSISSVARANLESRSSR